jgi:hypothetical protein
MGKKEEGAGASPPASTKKRPASPTPAAAKEKPHHEEKEQYHPHHEKEEHPHHPKEKPHHGEKAEERPHRAHHPLHDDRLPVDVVEEGRIYFFYRPRVAPASTDTSHAVSDVSDIQKTYLLLAPLAASDKNVGEGREALAAAEDRDEATHGRPLNRVFVLPRKTLPGKSGEPRLAICAKVSESVKELTDGLKASTYETKTRGLRQQPAARVVARGAYMIVAPTAGPVARAAHKAQQQEGKEEEEENGEDGSAQKAKKARRATPAEKAAEAARAARHGRPVNSARLLWLLEAPRHDGPAQQMLSIEHRGAFVVKVKGPLGKAGGGAGGGWAPPPPKPEDLPEPAKARLTAAHTQWVEVDSHAALDFKGAQLLMVAQYGAGGTAGGPGSLEAGGIKQDRAAMAEEAGPEVAAALADLVAEDERALKADARAHGEPARGELGAALRRAMLRELSSTGGDEEGEEEEDWAAAHHEEAEAQLRLHERQEAEEEEVEGGAAGAGGGKEEAAGGIVVDPAITGEIV